MNLIKSNYKINDNYVFYAVFLRFLAAVLITNSHYSNIYPCSIMASGGLLGDVIFFAISGFGLAYVNISFPQWYKKRVSRIYPPLLIITTIYLLLGYYQFNSDSIILGVVNLFIYPTYYHFVGSIIILYVGYYFVMKIDYLNKRIPLVILLVIIVQIMMYIFYIDKSYYHIDSVNEPFIRFIFFESMLIGAYFRKHQPKINVSNLLILLLLFISLIVYFASKISFSNSILVDLQIFNQLILLVVLVLIFYLSSQLENTLRNLPTKLKYIINMIATITLEIYFVQYVLIDLFDDIVFPVNWIIVTASILIAALLLNTIVLYLRSIICKH